MYLNKCLLKPETAIVNNVNAAKECAEHDNFQMASNLAAGKTRLIDSLSQFPATALWLLHRYEADGYKPEPVSLAEIKNYYLRASLAFSGRGFDREADADEKQHLTEALRVFPFSFDDLVVLIGLVIYAFKTRDDCHQSVESHPDLVARRLESSNRHGKSNLPDIVEAMRGSQFDQHFLFLPGADMGQYVTDMIFAEHLWLSSRQALAEANSGLVLFIANRYKSGFLDFDDLVQEGQTGLLRAIDKFDGRLGFQFSTYAAY